MTAWAAMRLWSPRRWGAALLASGASLVLLGVPTAMIPNPVFARRIVAPAWTYPSLAVTALLAGLLLATYVRQEPGQGSGATALGEASPQETRSFTVGGLLAFFAIGCPTCNKLVLLALGTSGAVTWFEPVQPLLSLAGIAVLLWALNRRLLGEVACSVPAASA
jgi:hypothetical protein